MTDNEKKAQEIRSKDPCQVWIGGCPNVYTSAMEMAKYKDVAIKRLEAENAKLKQKLSELQTAVCDWGETEDILNG